MGLTMNVNKKPWYKTDGFAYLAVWVLVPTFGIFVFGWTELAAVLAGFIGTVLVAVFEKR